MKTITIRDDFSALKEFTANLPQTFDQQGYVIHNSRNVIKKINTGDGTFVVKNFKGMYLFNRLAYSLFRQSKAARSYLHSAMLNEKGIATPPHVAWMDCYTMGLLTRSYFISVFYPYRTLNQMIDYYEIYDKSLKQKLLNEFAAFVKKLHKLDIYHEDLSVGNILVIRTLEGYDFALVDLNRIKFRPIEFVEGLHNFAKLRMPADDLSALIREYARLSGRDADSAVAEFWKFERRRTYLRQLRRRIRRYTLTPIERIFHKPHA